MHQTVIKSVWCTQTIVNWQIKFSSDEHMSGTADWSDTTNTLNNTVKHIHWCVVINKDEEESNRNN